MTEEEENKLWKSLPKNSLIKLQNIAKKNYQECGDNKKGFWESKVKRLGKLIWTK